jgi:hypothetical protein
MTPGPMATKGSKSYDISTDGETWTANPGAGIFWPAKHHCPDHKLTACRVLPEVERGLRDQPVRTAVRGRVALADQRAGRPLGPISPLLYHLAKIHDPGIIDVQGPANTFSHAGTTVQGFPAGPGYDLVTGLGTIDAAKFVPDLAQLALQEVGGG